MDSFLIQGGTRLKGKVEISGSKNSSLPIVAAALMTMRLAITCWISGVNGTKL